MRRLRLSWIIVAVVVVVVAATPTLRQLAGRQLRAALHRPAERGPVAQWFFGEFFGFHVESPAAHGMAWSSAPDIGERAIPFVLAHHADDAEMLTAAAYLAEGEADNLERQDQPDEAEALREQSHLLLKRAASPDGPAACWAAYAEDTLWHLSCDRIGTLGIDPGDAEATQEARWQLEERLASDAEMGFSEPTPGQVEEALGALRGWQQADPENAMPVALRAWVLYALERDDEAMAALKEAASLPIATGRGAERGESIRALALELGASPLDALLEASNVWTGLWCLSKLRSLARIAVYEGRRAQLEGRPEDAIALWMAAVHLGRSCAKSAYTTIEHLSAIATEGIAGSPVWRWSHDSSTGIPEGPLLGGRFMYGPQYEFYVEHMGEEAADEIRDHLLVVKLRSAMHRDHIRDDTAYERLVLAGYFPFIGQLVAGAGLPLLALLVLLGFFGRSYRVPEEWARRLRRLAVWLLVVTAIAIAWALVGARLFPESPVYPGLPVSLFALPGLLVFVTTFLFALLAWADRGPFIATWSASLRRIVAPMLALLAVWYLAISIMSVSRCCQLAQDLAQPEMERLIEWAGPEWHNPTIPPDAWRAEYPPNLEP
jgi:hypothetical protein